MDMLIMEVMELVEHEYGRASAKFGPTNHSDHESYAVILEEIQEAKLNIDSFEKEMSVFWDMVKDNADDRSKCAGLRRMQSEALLGACELIQVAAMAKKAVLTVCDRGNVLYVPEVVCQALEERGCTNDCT